MSSPRWNLVNLAKRFTLEELEQVSRHEFKSDARKIAFVETVFEDENKLGKFFFACNCDDSRFPSGCKGKTCLHVVVAMIEAAMIKTRAKDRKISNYHHKKGASRKNTKQN